MLVRLLFLCSMICGTEKDYIFRAQDPDDKNALFKNQLPARPLARSPALRCPSFRSTGSTYLKEPSHRVWGIVGVKVAAVVSGILKLQQHNRNAEIKLLRAATKQLELGKTVGCPLLDGQLRVHYLTHVTSGQKV